MPATPHRALRFILRLFSGFLAIGGLVLIFGNKSLFLLLFLSPPESEFSTLLLVMLKEVGGFLLMVSALCFLAARDPERNVAVVDGLMSASACWRSRRCSRCTRWTFAASIPRT